MKQVLKDIQKALLSGVSFMMPIVVAGGVILAVSLLGAEQTATGLVPANSILKFLNTLGKAGMAMMIPVFSAYIAYAMAGKPGLTPGFILGYLANNVVTINGTDVRTGFLGAMVLGILSGYVVKWMKTWNVGKSLRSVMPIIIIPVTTVLSLGLVYYFVIGYPIAILVNELLSFMTGLSTTNAIGLAILMGALAEIDFGGPVTKTVSMFTLALINEGVFWPNGIFRVLVATPPIGIFLATLLFKAKFSEEDRDNAKAVGIMGCLGITEGAIPYALKDPKSVYPATILGGITGALIALFGKVECPVPHGGFIVLPVITSKVWFVVAILAGALVTALVLGLLRKKAEETPEVK
ncbi:MAG: PTS fructose transporter subunit IIC [Erysipelotrichaceae bacterium]|nr:PTS fructose transporter subunit IIC [Erysipelotrichaceae bacterium]MDY6034612.1 PTS fructose transporter subunit IIC [Bulleidia sp.]